jgi:hypothetical protein
MIRLRIMVRLVGRWLGGGTAESRVDGTLELCNRVPFIFGCLRTGVADIVSAEIDESRRIRDLLACSALLDEEDYVPLHLAVLQGEADLLARLDAGQRLYTSAE